MLGFETSQCRLRVPDVLFSDVALFLLSRLSVKLYIRADVMKMVSVALRETTYQ